MIQKITPFLWFDNQAEEAIKFYTSVFKNSKIESINRYQDGPMKGKVLTGVFQLEGQRFMALDGGPQFEFTEAISFYVNCSSQEEVDYLWDKLLDGGEEQMCGWLKDKYGVAWQIIPAALPELLNDPDPAKSQRVMEAMLQMKKIEVPKLKEAYEQE
jgi:predicted 3-demethylubiquinone-9 3-methyltransferase (glyoxalase superfamily)